MKSKSSSWQDASLSSDVVFLRKGEGVQCVKVNVWGMVLSEWVGYCGVLAFRPWRDSWVFALVCWCNLMIPRVSKLTWDRLGVNGQQVIYLPFCSVRNEVLLVTLLFRPYAVALLAIWQIFLCSYSLMRTYKRISAQPFLLLLLY